jgi:hypothetical protein
MKAEARLNKTMKPTETPAENRDGQQPLPPATYYAASPALTTQSKYYPANYRGRVPKKIKMAKTLYPDLPWMPGIKPGTMLELNMVYDCWVNSHGAVAGWCDNGEKLGVKPGEFDVVEWHELKPHNVES